MLKRRARARRRDRSSSGLDVRDGQLGIERVHPGATAAQRAGIAGRPDDQVHDARGELRQRPSRRSGCARNRRRCASRRATTPTIVATRVSPHGITIRRPMRLLVGRGTASRSSGSRPRPSRLPRASPALDGSGPVEQRDAHGPEVPGIDRADVGPRLLGRLPAWAGPRTRSWSRSGGPTAAAS